LIGNLSIDAELLLLINGWNSKGADEVMFSISNKWSSLPVYAGLAIYFHRNYRQRFLTIVLLVAAMILLSDQLSNIFKYLVERPRPCHDPALQHLVHRVHDKCGGQFGFYSAHASNTAALATLSSFLIPSKNARFILISWCVLIGYSRIYLGAHYPGDVIAGWFFGSLIGYSAYRIFVSPKFFKNQLVAGK